MKILQFISIVCVSISLVACNDTGSKPSIKDNSTRDLGVVKTEDYSDVPSEQLHKHILAHFDLGQYKVGKEKLKALRVNRPDLIDSLNLDGLKQDFDVKLSEITAKEEAIAEKSRKLRMPNATKNMRISQKNNLTYYIDNSSPEFDSTESFYAYYTKNKAGVVKLYLKIRYISTEWLDIENYIITVDQLDYNLSGEVEKIETKGKKRFKHELLDTEIDSSKELILLSAIANGNEASAVYVGKSTYKKREISKEQKIAIRNVMDAYLFMGGMDLKGLKNSYTNN